MTFNEWIEFNGHKATLEAAWNAGFAAGVADLLRKQNEALEAEPKWEQVGIESRLNQKDGAIEAAPSQEPVAEVVSHHQAGMYDELPIGTLLYTHPSDAAAQIAYWQGRAESWERDAKVLQAENEKLQQQVEFLLEQIRKIKNDHP